MEREKNEYQKKLKDIYEKLRADKPEELSEADEDYILGEAIRQAQG